MTSEVAAAMARFFEQGRGPSHDELSRLFRQSGLDRFDPSNDQEEKVGKLKRVRAVLMGAAETDPAAALRLARELTATLKARGCFDPASEHFPGLTTIAAAQRAFAAIGWSLVTGGDLFPATLSSLEGRELTDALASYVRRIQRGGDDAALTIGSAKDLLEAAARHILVELTSSYDPRQGFAATLVQAAASRGTAIPPTNVISALDADPLRALEQSLLLAALAINRLRNEEGTGHGRPHPTKAQRRVGVLAAETAAAICYLLIPDQMD